MGEFNEPAESRAAIENAVFHAVNLEMQFRSGIDPDSDYGLAQSESVEALLAALAPDERQAAESRIEEEVAQLPDESPSERQRRELNERISGLEKKIEEEEDQ